MNTIFIVTEGNEVDLLARPYRRAITDALGPEVFNVYEYLRKSDSVISPPPPLPIFRQYPAKYITPERADALKLIHVDHRKKTWKRYVAERLNEVLDIIRNTQVNVYFKRGEKERMISAALMCYGDSIIGSGFYEKHYLCIYNKQVITCNDEIREVNA